MAGHEMFGRYFKQLRQRNGETLRDFCAKNSLDPGNISKLERGLIPPPKSPEVLDKYSECLGIREGDNEYYTFRDLAAAASGQIPQDVMDDAALVAKLPLVFRTLRGQKVPDEDLNKLAELIRRA